MKVVKYILGVFFILGGIASFPQGTILTALFMIILGVIFLPPISDSLKEKFSFWKNKGIRYVSYIVIFFIAGVFIPKEATTIKENDSKIESKKKFIAEYIKKDTLDKSLKNVRNLAEIGSVFENYNFSFEHPKNYITEQYDSINKNTIVTFNPKFDFTDEDRTEYLLQDKTKGKLQNYIVKFTVNDNNEIISKKTNVTYSKAGEVEYNNEEIPALSSFVDNETVETKKAFIAMEKQALKQKDEHEKRLQEFEKKCLKGWDGEHRELVKLVKENMHNPKSFEHVETRYGVTGDYAGIVMTYRGTNMYGAVVTNSIKAKVSLEDCSIISVEE